MSTGRRWCALIVATMLVAVAAGPVALAATAPTLTLQPDTGSRGEGFKSVYDWLDCGGLSAGTYVVEVSWDVTTDVIASSLPFDYSGSGNCHLSINTIVPSDASGGAHTVLALLRDTTKKGVQPGSDTKAGFTVLVPPTPKPSPKPTATPRPGATPGPGETGKVSPGPSSAPTGGPTGTPGASTSPSGSPPGSPEPSIPGEELPLPRDLPAEQLAGELVAEAQPLPDDGSGIDRALVNAADFAVNVALGGITDLLIGLSRGMDLLASPISGPDISNSAGEAVDPDVAGSTQNVYLVWADSAGDNWEIMFARSTDHGYNFAFPMNLSNNTGASEHPRVVANGLLVTVAWDDDTRGDKEIRAISSTDGGLHWGPQVVVAPGAKPVLAASGVGSTAFVAWIAKGESGVQELFVQQIGVGSPNQISRSGGDARNPAIAASGSNVSVAWENNPLGDWDIGYANSADRGGTWQSTLFSNIGGLSVSRWSDYGDDLNPSVFASGSEVFVAYEQNKRAQRVVLLRWSSDDGRSFFAGLESRGFHEGFVFNRRIGTRDLLYDVNDTPYGDPMLPSVVAGGRNWSLVYLTALATTVGNRTNVTWFGADRPGSTLAEVGQRDADRPETILADGRTVVAWQARTNAAAPFDIVMSVAGGATRFNSATSGDSTGPRMASSSANVTVVWTETSDGSRQVYFATRPVR